MQQNRWHATIDEILTHVIIVACHHSLFGCMAALLFLVLPSLHLFEPVSLVFLLCKFTRMSPTLFYSCAFEPHLYMKRGMHVRKRENCFQQIRKFSLASEVTNVLLVKDHMRKGKESFYVKTKESAYATFAVGQFN